MGVLGSRLVLLGLVTALGGSTLGCYSKATGYQGKFTFAYASSVEVENFVKPLAPGAKLDVVAFANGTEDELVVTGATSSKPGVLAIESVREHTVVVKGVEPGVAELEITARDKAGNTLVDKIFFHVAKPTVHPLEHACTDGREAVYVAGESVTVYHGLATSDHRPVIGYAYAPVRVEPAAALELVAQPQSSSVYLYRARGASARVTLRSTVDDSALSLRIVERGALKEATISCGSTADDCRFVEGASRYVGAHVQMGELPVCSQNALTKARSLTPDICSVSAKLEDDDGTDTNREQLAVVTGLKFGICKFEMTLPELDGGRGVRLAGTAKIGRLEFPRDGGSAAPSSSMLRSGVPAWGLGAIGWLGPKLAALLFVAGSRRRRVSAALASMLRRSRG